MIQHYLDLMVARNSPILKEKINGDTSIIPIKRQANHGQTGHIYLFYA